MNPPTSPTTPPTRPPLADVTDDQKEFFKALLQVSTRLSKNGPPNPIRHFVEEVFGEWINVRAAIVRDDCQRRPGRLIFGPRFGAPSLDERLHAASRPILRNWARRWKFIALPGAVGGKADYVGSAPLASWIIDLAEKCVKRVCSRDETLARSIGVQPQQSQATSAHEYDPIRKSDLPDVPRIDGMEAFEYPRYEKGNWAKYRASVVREFNEHLESRKKSKPEPIALPRRTKSGKKYQPLHYEFAALKFCGKNGLGWKRIHAMYPEAGITREAMILGARDVVSRVGLRWPGRN